MCRWTRRREDGPFEPAVLELELGEALLFCSALSVGEGGEVNGRRGGGFGSVEGHRSGCFALAGVLALTHHCEKG